MKTQARFAGVRRNMHSCLAAAFGLALATIPAGCVSMKALVFPEKAPPAVSQIAATWENKVLFAPDPTHGGKASPGLAGRLYLFGEETGHPMVGDGSVAVDLFDDTPTASGGQPKLIEKWLLDKDTVKRLLRRDMIGQGYTLFLPWGTFKPEINQVHLMVTYTPLKGNPLYAPSSTIALDKDGSSVARVTRRTVVPGTGSQNGGPSGAGDAQPAQWHSRFVVPDPAKRGTEEQAQERVSGKDERAGEAKGSGA